MLRQSRWQTGRLPPWWTWLSFTRGACSFFDLDRYRVVLFDQRGSGHSLHLANEHDADLSTNTTDHPIADIEALRQYHQVASWTVLGLSWGTTLGLAYAQARPEAVNALVLALVTTTSRREVNWLTQDVARLFPEEWDRFASVVPDDLRHLRPVDAYALLLFDSDPAIQELAAREWCAWEDTHVSLTPGHRPNPRFDDRDFRLRFARLVTHYWRTSAFLEDDQLIRDAPILNGIPGMLIHGRYDVSSPLETAWRLSRQWSTSELQVLDNAGHGGGDTFHIAVSEAPAQFAPR